jgi:hypothetical protein
MQFLAKSPPFRQRLSELFINLAKAQSRKEKK